MVPPYIGHTFSKVWVICILVSLVFVFFWRFQHSPIVKTLNLNVWTLPLIFLHDFTLFVIDMHQNRSVSLFSTPFDHFHFHALAALKWWVQLRSCHIFIIQILQWLSRKCTLGSTEYVTLMSLLQPLFPIPQTNLFN